jgi:photosystem II stability/assembly factor-like uncharacterized protein
MRAGLLIAIVLSIPSTLRADEIQLGQGVSVHRQLVPCSYDATRVCSFWTASGLTFGDRIELPAASTFVRSPSGRIVAMIPRQGPLWLAPNRAMLLYTDDLGATWHLGDWPDSMLHAVSIAFDPGGRLAVAVGPDGSVWSSHDDGASFVRRRSSTGVGFRRVWVRHRTALIEDANGALWISRDGGFALESFAERDARVDASGAELIITKGARTTRIDARGSVQRR